MTDRKLLNLIENPIMSSLLAEPPTNPISTFSSDPDRLFEVVDGLEVELPPMSVDSTTLAFELAFQLTTYGLQKQLGKAYPFTKIKLPLTRERKRIPYAIYIPFTRWAKDKPKPKRDAWNVLPFLCIEVVSPTDNSIELQIKINEYLEARVDQVWVVYPDVEEIHIRDNSANSRILKRKDTLDGGDIIPGFQLPLSDLFLADAPALESAES